MLRRSLFGTKIPGGGPGWSNSFECRDPAHHRPARQPALSLAYLLRTGMVTVPGTQVPILSSVGAEGGDGSTRDVVTLTLFLRESHKGTPSACTKRGLAGFARSLHVQLV
jgi:hypothetical protein